ncbi:hypothetical protein [Anaerocellum diazotrophicum]|uniref:Uncharacterized protein n=1 Tax=Caldicellulosiruptor diazotrophicus TaxID=2806205 RepID=A0ABN6E914_9FIRM|nr:hypothetical protein [Caldicellulosiruptor diazotrophicus]BCS82011.1 hypothetical protein CaldiYA01_19710 [Caldicellulosiruptor diazotrophicus]
MKRKIIFNHIVFLIIIASIFFILFKNYSKEINYFNKALNNLKAEAFLKIRDILWNSAPDNIISNKNSIILERILYLKSEAECMSFIISALEYIDTDSNNVPYYKAKLHSMYSTFSNFVTFLSKVYDYIKDGEKPFNLPNDKDIKFIIKTKKDIYNELLLYHDFFSKLDINVIGPVYGNEVFNKIIEKWSIEKADKIIYPSKRIQK